MEQRPSEECGDCFWWYEDPLLCRGCPNNPDTKESRKTHSDEIVSLLKEKVVLADV
jgi:hypothetical protein